MRLWYWSWKIHPPPSHLVRITCCLLVFDSESSCFYLGNATESIDGNLVNGGTSYSLGSFRYSQSTWFVLKHNFFKVCAQPNVIILAFVTMNIKDTTLLNLNHRNGSKWSVLPIQVRSIPYSSMPNISSNPLPPFSCHFHC